MNNLAVSKNVYYLLFERPTMSKSKLKPKPHAKPIITKEAIARFNEVKAKRKDNRIFCYNCKGETRQNFLFEKGELIAPQEIVFFDEKGKRKGNAWTIDGRIWRVSQCQGCERINLNVYMRHSPFEHDVLIHHFPPKDFRPFPMWVTHLSKDFTELFAEIYISLNLGNFRLPLMGARTVLDMFIVEKIGDMGSFKIKLQKLVDEKYISSSARDLLEVALEYGNATIHRGYVPKKEEINSVLDIIENLLRAETLIDETEELKESMPKRK
jgi:hypothetical protein